jgi:lysozyme
LKQAGGRKYTMARRRSSRTQLRWLGAILLIAVIAAVVGWWYLRHWQPDRTAYPVQGIEISAEDGEVDWRAVKAIGADFAYIDASASAFARDPAFARNLEEARAAKLQVGAVHRYDPCQPAERQAANFVTVVPRETVLLPPAVELDMTAETCPLKVSDAKIESELMTYVNEVETHTGKAVLLKVSPVFEQRYHIAHTLDRNLWLIRDRYQPDYGDRPWTLWTANSALENEAGTRALRWIVVQP